MMKISDFNYDLPEGLIAQTPSKVRDRSNLLILDRQTGKMEHRKFYQIVDFLQEDDALVINDTKVFPARLLGRKKTGGKAEVLLLEKVEEGRREKKEYREDWTCLINIARPLKEKSIIQFDKKMKAEVLLKKGEIYRIRIVAAQNPARTIEKIGFSPLPPYIKRGFSQEREEGDRERYQTVYATEKGAVAAPTAGLHFTESLLEKLKQRNVEVIPLTLHINLGTFRPVRVENIENHEMHSEYFKLTKDSARRINEIKAKKGKIIAVGSTVVRTIEFLADDAGKVSSGEGANNLFIYPGFRFKVIDGLITNFHLPRSTLLMLVSAFAGKDKVLSAYAEAIRKGYRFYSYGDAMLII